MFHLKNDDVKALSRVLGIMSILSVISFNPIMGVAVICISAYAFVVKKNELDKKEFIKGGAVSGIAAIVFKAVGLQVILEFIIFLALVQILKKKIIGVKEIQNKLYELSSAHNELVKLMIGSEFEYQRLFSSSKSAVSDARTIQKISEEKVENREKKLDLIKKMK